MALGQSRSGESNPKGHDVLSALVRLLAVQAAHEAAAASSVGARPDEDPENEQEQDRE